MLEARGSYYNYYGSSREWTKSFWGSEARESQRELLYEVMYNGSSRVPQACIWHATTTMAALLYMNGSGRKLGLFGVNESCGTYSTLSGERN